MVNMMNTTTTSVIMTETRPKYIVIGKHWSIRILFMPLLNKHIIFTYIPDLNNVPYFHDFNELFKEECNNSMKIYFNEIEICRTQDSIPQWIKEEFSDVLTPELYAKIDMYKKYATKTYGLNAAIQDYMELYGYKTETQYEQKRIEYNKNRFHINGMPIIKYNLNDVYIIEKATKPLQNLYNWSIQWYYRYTGFIMIMANHPSLDPLIEFLSSTYYNDTKKAFIKIMKKQSSYEQVLEFFQTIKTIGMIQKEVK